MSNRLSCAPGWGRSRLEKHRISLARRALSCIDVVQFRAAIARSGLGTASGVAHLGVRGRKVTYFGDDFEMEGLTSPIVYHDLFGSLQG